MPARFAVCFLLLAFTCLTAQAGPLDIADIWTDDKGNQVSLSHWRGRPLVMAMEFSECRFICATSLRKLQEVQAEASRRKLAIEFVLVSLDPKNDTPAAWQRYRRSRDLPHANWTFLTGSRQATDRMVQALGVHWWDYDGHIMHDLKIVRLAADGKIVREMKTFDMTAAEFLDGYPAR